MQWKKQNYTLLPQGETYTPNPPTKTRLNRRWLFQWALPGLLAAVVLVALAITQIKSPKDRQTIPESGKPACPQYRALKPPTSEREKLEREVREEINSEDFFNKSWEKMQGAVRIKTESFDDMGQVGEDARWDVFADFQQYLKETFPRVFSTLEFTPVNTYGILLEWKGKNESLKPYLFTGHQDVVPVPAVTESNGHILHTPRRFIWGRGATDCKNVLIGILEALETLLEKDYTPERTILAGFGFDEEISGDQDAQAIAKNLEETRGEDSLELILDEGGLGTKEMDGAVFALPGLGEKGYFDVRVTVETAGGHSSVPPDHTGIGILSTIIDAIEANPYEPELTPANPYFTTLPCTAEYSPNLDSWLRKTIQRALSSQKAAKRVADYLSHHDISQRYLMQTSQATDLIAGGVKINALPEKVYAVINHRIAVESRVADVRSHLQSLLASHILSRFSSLSLDAWGEVSGNPSAGSTGQISLGDFDEALEPFAGVSVRQRCLPDLHGDDQTDLDEVLVAPSLMTGNPDTKFYWGLSRNISRFAPVREGGREHAQLILNGDHVYILSPIHIQAMSQKNHGVAGESEDLVVWDGQGGTGGGERGWDGGCIFSKLISMSFTGGMQGCRDD